MIITETISIEWHFSTKNHYIAKGYKFTSLGEAFEIKVEDLVQGSEFKVQYSCDYCGKVGEKKYKEILKSRKNISKDCCNSVECMKVKRKEVGTKRRGRSVATMYPQLAAEWDYSRNKVSPEDQPPHSRDYVWWRCSEGHVWKTRVYKRTQLGRGCHYCSGREVDESNSLSTVSPEIAAEWDYGKNGDLTPNDVVSCSGKKVWWRCKEGHSWLAQISSRDYGTGCPVCKESKGEKRVRDWLIRNNIKFEREYYFDDLVGLGGKVLRFDFAILDEEGNLQNLVEYDGAFHFRKMYDDDNFDLVQKHDKLKNEYCSEKNIKLIRIHFKDFEKVENILYEKLIEGSALHGNPSQ